jgi:hypothetical protein
MSDADKNEVVIADLQISSISDSELEAAFKSVVAEHKDAVASIHKSMVEADNAYRKYLDPAYEPEEAGAKKDRATLNKAEKNIAEKYAGLKAAYEKPLENVELNIKSIRNAIKAASGVVDSSVKTYEEAQKEKKRKGIEEYFATKGFDLVPLDRLFNDKWLNKGAKMANIREELDSGIAEVYQNIETLEQLPEHGPMAKALYLETLDMGAAMRQVNALKANAERLAREQVEREERKLREQVEANTAEQRRETWGERRDETLESLAAEALNLPEEPVPTAADKPQIIEFVCRFWGTENSLRQLRNCMSDLNIAYQKGMIFANDDAAALFMRQHNIAGSIESLIFIEAIKQ